MMAIGTERTKAAIPTHAANTPKLSISPQILTHLSFMKTTFPSLRMIPGRSSSSRGAATAAGLLGALAGRREKGTGRKRITTT